MTAIPLTDPQCCVGNIHAAASGNGLPAPSCPCVGVRVSKILCHDQNTAGRRGRGRSSVVRRYTTGVFLLTASLLLSVNAVSAFGARSYHHRCIPTRLAAASDDDASILSSPKLSSSSGPPFRLERIDHVVIRCKNFPRMFDFYHRILGCTIDEPTDDHVNRFGGALTHLRAGSCYIDLLAYDTNHLTKEGKDAAARMHAGGVGLDGKSLDDIDLSADTSTLDHLCLRIEPFDRDQLVNYLQEERVDIVIVGAKRLGADGVGPSVYARDPEGNVIELKGSPYPENGQKGGADANAKSKQSGKPNGASDVTIKKGKESADRNNALADIDDTVEDATHINAIKEESSSANVPLTPCNRICRYNSSFYDGQVCIGCFREAYEIEMWQSMTPMQKSMTLLDAIDRCSDNQLGQENGEDNFDGAIAIEELNRQYDHWSELAKQC